MIYLDWAATAVPDTEISAQAAELSGRHFANPSSEHRPGSEARKLITEARDIWAEVIGCRQENIIFTSGGTEGNNLVLQHLLYYKKRPRALISGIEHASLYEPLLRYQELGITVSIIDPELSGHLSAEKFAAGIQEDTRFIALTAVHNETGAVQPLEDIVSALRQRERDVQQNIHIHIDGVQALGKIPIRVGALDIDSASFSSHKIGGPKGAGVLYLRRPVRTLTLGGEQEFNLRPGTENLYAIYGSALAARKAVRDLSENRGKARELMSLLLNRFGETEYIEPFYSEPGDQYSPFINTLFTTPLPGEAAVRALSDAGVAVGTGSACSSTKSKRVRGLKSMGLAPQQYECAVRVSTGFTTKPDDILTLHSAFETSVLPLIRTLRGS